MAEYICCKRCDSPNCKGCNINTLSKMLYAGKFDCIMDKHHSINPTADVVEVVRCKDCIRWTPDGGYGLDLDGTKRLYGECASTKLSHKENHFCSYGAKMNDVTDTNVGKIDGKGDK